MLRCWEGQCSFLSTLWKMQKCRINGPQAPLTSPSSQRASQKTEVRPLGCFSYSQVLPSFSISLPQVLSPIQLLIPQVLPPIRLLISPGTPPIQLLIPPRTPPFSFSDTQVPSPYTASGLTSRTCHLPTQAPVSPPCLLQFRASSSIFLLVS